MEKQPQVLDELNMHMKISEIISEDFTGKAKPGSRPGSIKRKASQYLGKGAGKDGVSKSEAKRLMSKANKMKKSKNKAERDRGIQLYRQASFVLNMGGKKK